MKRHFLKLVPWVKLQGPAANLLGRVHLKNGHLGEVVDLHITRPNCSLKAHPIDPFLVQADVLSLQVFLMAGVDSYGPWLPGPFYWHQGQHFRGCSHCFFSLVLTPCMIALTFSLLLVLSTIRVLGTFHWFFHLASGIADSSKGRSTRLGGFWTLSGFHLKKSICRTAY